MAVISPCNKDCVRETPCLVIWALGMARIVADEACSQIDKLLRQSRSSVGSAQTRITSCHTIRGQFRNLERHGYINAFKTYCCESRDGKAHDLEALARARNHIPTNLIGEKVHGETRQYIGSVS